MKSICSELDLVLNQIEREELTRIALESGNIDSPPGQEKPLSEFIETWL
jgi:hypothetical protein